MKKTVGALVFCMCQLAGGTSLVHSQQPIPIVSLAAPSARASEKLGTVLGVREISNGTLLVDDGGNRQLRLFDASLNSSIIVLDSADGIPNAYGRRAAPIIRYAGDSTLIPDFASVALLVIDGNGKVVRSMALPNAADFNLLRSGATADQQGRLIFVGEPPISKSPVTGERRYGDSVPLLRADFDTRRTDTIAKIARPLTRTRAEPPGGAAQLVLWTADLLHARDVWAVLSDGTVAIVRGHDYHVDWIHANGKIASTPKLSFDWRRLTETDKARISDSARTQMTDAIMDGSIAERIISLDIVKNPNAPYIPPRVDARPAPPTDPNKKASPFSGFTLLPGDALTPDSIADYYPPVRANAVLADLDGNVWILPTTSKASINGELVYDVVNGKGELFKRVRLPLGKLLVGFGKNGMVYTTSGSIATGFVLERAQLPVTNGSR